jgi:hypothetical protein
VVSAIRGRVKRTNGSRFRVVKLRFAGVPSEIYKMVSAINTFRNDFVAHQTKELTDSALARKALQEWAGGLRQIWKLHG